eukprot:2075794-Rhodomonas_salina.5
MTSPNQAQEPTISVQVVVTTHAHIKQQHTYITLYIYICICRLTRLPRVVVGLPLNPAIGDFRSNGLPWMGARGFIPAETMPIIQGTSVPDWEDHTLQVSTGLVGSYTPGCVSTRVGACKLRQYRRARRTVAGWYLIRCVGWGYGGWLRCSRGWGYVLPGAAGKSLGLWKEHSVGQYRTRHSERRALRRPGCKYSLGRYRTARRKRVGSGIEPRPVPDSAWS